MLGGIVEIVELDAVSKKRKEMGKGEKVSGGPDGGRRAASGVLERCESPVLGETL